MDNVSATATADDVDNMNPHPKCKNSIGDLDGIRQVYSPAEYNNLDEYVNTCNSTTDKTKLTILETHHIANEANVGNNGLPDNIDNYGVICDRTDEANLPPLPPKSNIPYIHSIIEEVNKDFKFLIDISNVKSAHDYSDNDDNNDNDNDNMYNDTVLNQVDSNNNTIIFNEYNTISAIKHKVNEEYMFWKTDTDCDNIFSHNNNHNQDDENNYDDQYSIHPEFINSNPSMIPNDGDRVVLLSSVSRVVKNNNEAKDNEVSSIPASIFIDTVKLVWFLKRYTVNNNNMVDIRWYTVDNNNTVGDRVVLLSLVS